MKFNALLKSLVVLFMIGSPILLLNSCDKATSLLLTDSEKLMKDLKGTYNLVSVRYEDFYSNDGGESIACLVLFNPPASYLEGWVEEHDNDHVIIRISEAAWDYSVHKNRYFRFEK